jgi:hypothetical protein
MSKRKHGLGLFGLLALTALVVMAFASSAQALVPKFFVNGTLAPATGTPIEGISGKGTLIVPAINTEINCVKDTATGNILNVEKGDVKVLFEECTVLEITAPLAEISTCHVSDVHLGKPEKLHVTVLEKTGKPIEFDKTATDVGVLFEGISVFVNFLKEMGCPLPMKTEVKGAVCALIDNNETVEPTLLFSEAIQKLEGCGDKLLYGANESFIIGSAKVFLPGKTKTIGVLLD